jgi:hypothetical protein
MSRRFDTLLAVLVLALGCAAPLPEEPASEQLPPDAGPVSSQEGYTFAGCEPATYGCPQDLTFGCALRALAAKHGRCQVDSDCVALALSTCVGLGECPPFFVSTAGVTTFRAEAQAETERYCATATCRSAGQCAQPQPLTPRCEAGLCVGAVAPAP